MQFRMNDITKEHGMIVIDFQGDTDMPYYPLTPQKGRLFCGRQQNRPYGVKPFIIKACRGFLRLMP